MKKILFMLTSKKLELLENGFYYEIYANVRYHPNGVSEKSYVKFTDALKNNEGWADLRRFYIGK